MDFFRNPRAASFGSAVTHPLSVRPAPAPAPAPRLSPIPAQQVPTSTPFPAPQQQAPQAGLHPSTFLLEKKLFRSWEMNDQDNKMAEQYINWNTQQGHDDWTAGAFNDYLKQGIEPPPQLKEYFKSQKMDYDEVKTPTTEWASLPDRDKAGLLTAYYEGNLRDPWQQKTVARMIQQEAEDAKKLPAPGGDTTPAHLRWLQEWYKQNVDPAKTPAKLQEQFVASKLVEEPAYTLNPAYTQYLQEMKASGLSLDDPSQWSERREWYKTHPRPSKYLWGKEKTLGWVSPEAEKAAWALNAQANQPAQAAAPAEAAPPAQAVGLRTQSPGAGAGTGTFTAQGPGGFTEIIGQPAPPKPPAPPVAQAPASTVGAAMGQQVAGVFGPSPVVQPGTPQPVAAQPSPVVQKRGGRSKPITLAGVPLEQAIAQAQVDAAQGGWEPVAAQPSPVVQKRGGRSKPIAPVGVSPRKLAKPKPLKAGATAPEVVGYIGEQIGIAAPQIAPAIRDVEQAGTSNVQASPSLISQALSNLNSAADNFDRAFSAKLKSAFLDILAGKTQSSADVNMFANWNKKSNKQIELEARAWLKEKERQAMKPAGKTPYARRRSGTYVGGKKRNLRGKPSVSSEMKRIVGESTWNKAMGGK